MTIEGTSRPRSTMSQRVRREWQYFLLIWIPTLCCIAYLFFDLSQSRDGAQVQAEQIATSYVRLVEAHASATFERTNIILERALDRLTADDALHARTLSADRLQNINQSLTELQRQGPGIVSMTVTDAQGYVFANTVGMPPGGSLADRRYFMDLKDHNDNRLVISELVFGRVSHKWGVQLARALHRADGGFSGMIVANVGMSEYFAPYYQQLALPRDTLISLRDMDFRIMVRFPAEEGVLNKAFPVSQVTQAFSHGRMEGIYHRPSPVDGIARTIAFRKLPNYPLMALVGLSDDTILADWRKARDRVVVVAAALLVSAIALTIALLRQRRLDLMLAAQEDRLLREEALRNDEERRRAEEQARHAEASNTAKSAFLAMMSHEIRTPMNGILGMVHLLSDSPLTASQQECLDIIRQSGAALLTILDDILDFSKLEANRLDLEDIPFNLRAFLETTVGLMRSRAASKGLSLTIMLAADLPKGVRGDPTRIRQVLLNFLSNAVKFTETGGVILEVSRTEIDFKQQGRVALRFAVTDSGIGIAPAVQSRLFHAFTQADNSITRRFGGTGLGLAICQRLVRLMNGEIGVDSRPGQGSTFWCVLPLPPADIAEEIQNDRPAVPPLAPLNVLLAEDNPVNRKVADAILSKYGHRVTPVEDGRHAVEAVQNHDFDLVLMDVQMPVMDGLQATRLLRDTGYTVPIIALTANAMHEDIQNCKDSGMDGYVAKPFTPEALIREITRVLHGDYADAD